MDTTNGHKFVAIEGVIGVGKTTLARLLKEHFDAEVLLEVFEENPFLADFYAERERYAFQTQLFFLLSRYQQQKRSVPKLLQRSNLFSDYTFAKDELFAWLNLRDDELAMYGRVHSALSEKIVPPHLLVYLQADHETVMQRIAQRDRPYERDMDPDYIRRLAAAYEAWLSNIADIPVLTIDVTNLDILRRSEDLLYIVAQIREALQTVNLDDGDTESAKSTHRLLPRSGSMTNYQEFHRYLDHTKNFSPDLFMNFIALTEEVGELAKVMKEMWALKQRLQNDGRDGEGAQREVIEVFRNVVGNELADIMAYVLKLANYMELDLEQAYLMKMTRNLDREWTY